MITAEENVMPDGCSIDIEGFEFAALAGRAR